MAGIERPRDIYFFATNAFKHFLFIYILIVQCLFLSRSSTSIYSPDDLGEKRSTCFAVYTEQRDVKIVISYSRRDPEHSLAMEHNFHWYIQWVVSQNRPGVSSWPDGWPVKHRVDCVYIPP